MTAPSLDSRDRTPEPPAYLDPWRVLLSARAVTCARDLLKVEKQQDWRMV